MAQRVSFVLRVTVDDMGRATGVLEVVRTGRKEPVPDIAALGAIVRDMLAADSAAHRDAVHPREARPDSSSSRRHSKSSLKRTMSRT